MLAIALALLFAAAALAGIVSLAEGWMKALQAFARLSREAALMEAGYVPAFAPRTVRLRAAGYRYVTARQHRSAVRSPGLARLRGVA